MKKIKLRDAEQFAQFIPQDWISFLQEINPKVILLTMIDTLKVLQRL